jgi:primosomal protein N' (replication factor Y)
MNAGSLFADLILPLPLAGLFTYSIPGELQNEVAIGKRVIVSFGSKKIYSGIVKNIHNNPPQDYEVKDIVACLDESPLINNLQFSFWDWLSDYYQSNLGDVYKAAIPAGLKLESQTKISYREDFNAEKQLSKTEELILDVLKSSKDVSIQTLNQASGLKNALPQVKKLLEKGAIEIEERVLSSYKEKQIKYVRLHRDFTENEIGEHLNNLNRAKKQQEILFAYLNLSKQAIAEQAEKVTAAELLHASNSNTPTLKALVDKQILEIYFESTDRLDFSEADISPLKELNQYQAQAISEIRKSFESKNTTLLHGVTSSGKTEIYIHLIQEQVEQGKQVLYLLPEIALTTQIISRLKRVFGNKVGVYHSKFNDAERVEVYNNIQKNNPGKSYQVILGVRSSIFLPFHNLGLIIIDEEHENTYKQFDPAPRYHARDAAIFLAHLHQAKTLLGTATPAIETYANCKQGKYALVELMHRFQDIKMPEILLADLKEAKRKKRMKSIFTPELFDEITMALDKNEQVILFQNRRGYAPFLECKSCGWVPHCDHCAVSLTYHQYNNQLTCHYCGHSTNPPTICAQCESTEMVDKGFGTEKIEDELRGFFPQARIARMDLDTTRSKSAYEKLIYKFENHEFDILVGTQMVSKGLDFDHVSLVGILNADAMLNFPDFRAHERSYQLMAQVSGRAGRKNKQGKVIIQTHEPKHPIIQSVVRNDYLSMYQTQISEREEYIYPPFYRLINIRLKHKNNGLLTQAANTLAQSLRKIFGIRVFGPQAPLVNRIQNYYIVNILMKIEKKSSPAKAKWILNREANNLKAIDRFKMVMVQFDVDPM